MLKSIETVVQAAAWSAAGITLGAGAYGFGVANADSYYQQAIISHDTMKHNTADFNTSLGGACLAALVEGTGKGMNETQLGDRVEKSGVCGTDGRTKVVAYTMSQDALVQSEQNVEDAKKVLQTPNGTPSGWIGWAAGLGLVAALVSTGVSKNADARLRTA